MVLKPSEIAPFDAMIFAEILDEAGVPEGVFNLVNGDGPGVGVALSSHPDVAMVSFTGSTRTLKSIGILAGPSETSMLTTVSPSMSSLATVFVCDSSQSYAAVC